MISINQKESVHLIAVKKTVEWLIDNTEVRVFDPIKFEGYQRQINDAHCNRIVDFLRKDFFLPTAIICATSENYQPESLLRVVDGQHRIHAFRILKRDYADRYIEIKDKEVPVIVIESDDARVEIDTFITINKTSRKVDTSLAFVLKNMINKYSPASDDLSMPRAEYLSVELALDLNTDENCKLWCDKILFEGNPKNTSQLISLNAFVKSTRTLINNFARKKLFVLDWKTQEEIAERIAICKELVLTIWNAVAARWPRLFDGDLEKRRIIQGAIGYSAVNRVVNSLIEAESALTIDSFRDLVTKVFRNISTDESEWLPGGLFPGFSSEAGYAIVARELLNSIK